MLQANHRKIPPKTPQIKRICGGGHDKGDYSPPGYEKTAARWKKLATNLPQKASRDDLGDRISPFHSNQFAIQATIEVRQTVRVEP